VEGALASGLVKETTPASYRCHNIALFGRDGPAVYATLLQLAQHLSSRGAHVLVETSVAQRLDGSAPALWTVCDCQAIGDKADLAIVLGGDGTILNVARKLVNQQVPLVGVNQGQLGYLTDIARTDLIERVDELLEGHFVADYRQMLTAKIARNGGLETTSGFLALNDVVLDKGALGRLIKFTLHIDGEHVYSSSGDGLIVATPTGSTAYALSAGGPILGTTLAGISLVPLCPHALTNRPLVVPEQAVIEITVTHGGDARIHLDGQKTLNLSINDRIIVCRSEQSTCFLRSPQYSQFATLREKLHWGTAPRN